MLSIFKRRRRTIEPVNADLRVHYINPDADTIDAGLGISEERCEELQQILVDACMAGEGTIRVEQTIEDMSLKVKHPNELAFLCFSFGAWLNQVQREAAIIKLFTGNQ